MERELIQAKIAENQVASVESCRLVMIPWCHGLVPSTSIGTILKF